MNLFPCDRMALSFNSKPHPCTAGLAPGEPCPVSLDLTRDHLALKLCAPMRRKGNEGSLSAGATPFFNR
jgi:hypothetical protein